MFFNLEKDIFGNVVGIYSNNELVLQIDYDAFGVPYYNKNLLNSNLPSENFFRFGYKSYYYDQESDLYFTGKEYYNPVTGRYLAPQSIDNISFEQDGLNLFAYCHNRPLNADQVQIKFNFNKHAAKNDTDIMQSFGVAIGNIGDFLGNVSSLAYLAENMDLVFYKKILQQNPMRAMSYKLNSAVFSTISKRLGFVGYVFAGISEFINSGDLLKSAIITGFGIFGAEIASFYASAVFGLIGGPVGALIGTLIAIGIEYLFITFAENLIKLW